MEPTRAAMREQAMVEWRALFVAVVLVGKKVDRMAVEMATM